MSTASLRLQMGHTGLSSFPRNSLTNVSHHYFIRSRLISHDITLALSDNNIYLQLLGSLFFLASYYFLYLEMFFKLAKNVLAILASYG